MIIYKRRWPTSSTLEQHFDQISKFHTSFSTQRKSVLIKIGWLGWHLISDIIRHRDF